MSFPSGGSDPTSGAVGDFNGDGVPDLVVANTGSGRGSVLLGDGTGRFGDASQNTLPILLTSIVAADFNGDAILDLAGITTVNNLGNGVGLLLGDGTAHFRYSGNASTDSPRSVAAGDFNGDGKLDLATANFYPKTVSIFPGNGLGQFGAVVVVDVGMYPSFVAASDFNQDGRPDLAVRFADSFSILINEGTWRFNPLAAIPISAVRYELIPADFNQDGAKDLAVLSNLRMQIFLGDGTGKFTNGSTIDTSYRAFATVGDFDQDGAPDLAVTEEGRVVVHLNNGQGSFNPAVYLDVPTGSFIAAEEFNGDDLTDLTVFSSSGGVGRVFIILGEGAGKFASAPPHFAQGFQSGAGIGDFDGDGNLDLALASISLPLSSFSVGRVLILKGDGTGRFTESRRYSVGRSPRRVAVGDFNGDNRLDLVVTIQGESKVQVLWGDGAGFFAIGPSYEVDPDVSTIVTGDFNGDGKLDVAVSSRPNRTVSVLVGEGTTGFAPAIRSPAGTNPVWLAAGDFNRDGKLDLAASGSEAVSILFGDGTGRFGAPRSFTDGSKLGSLTAGDFDQSGTLDLAVTSESPNLVAVLKGNGTGSFGMPTSYPLDSIPNDISTGDLNGDGRPDLVVANQDYITGVTVLLNDGTGGFGRKTNYYASGSPASVYVGDLNKDGKPDLLIPVTDNEVGVLLNTCGINLSPAFVTSLFFPRLVTDSNQSTGIAIVNLDTVAATLRFTAFEGTGSAVSGTNIRNPADLTLSAGSQIPIMVAQVFGEGLASRPLGWFKVESTVRKVAGFFLTLDPALTLLDGADVSSRTLTSFLFPEIEAGSDAFTQLHIANPNVESTQTTLQLVGAAGNVRARVDRTIESNGSMAEILTNLFPDSSPEPSDYVRVTADKGLVAFEFLGRTGRFVQGLNGQEAASGATTLYCPQYVVGGPTWRSTLSVVSLDDSSGSVTFRFIGDDGAVIGTQQRLIAPRGKLFIDDQSFFLGGGTQTQGYVEISSSGPRLAGSVVFGDQARSTFSSTLPLVANLKNDMIFAQVASAGQSSPSWFTGLAILNTGSTNANAMVQVFDENGAVVNSGNFLVPARRRLSQLLTQYFPNLAGRDMLRGYVRVTADQPLASFALFGTTTLSVLSAIPSQFVP